MSRAKIMARLEELEKQRGIGAHATRPIVFRFVKVPPEGGRATEITDRFLMRPDGTYRLPKEEEPNEDER